MILSLIISSCASYKSIDSPASNAVNEPSQVSEITDSRMVTYSVSLNLSVENADSTRKKLIENVKNNNGFIVLETDNSITSRIPTENMDNFINNSKTLGKTENESKIGTDITDQYRDNVLRLEGLKNVRDRYLALLDKANSINDILSIEKELERINIEIERLEGRVKYAELSVSYSNITVKFKGKSKVKPGPLGWVFYGLYNGVKWLFVWD
jgi:hypothetical protein